MRAVRQRRIRGDRGDRGAVLPFVAIVMVVLVGVGALVVDAGALYQERRELQNGADAAALAVAKDCAEGDCDDGPWAGGSAESTAQHFTNENAEDGASEIHEICGNDPKLVWCDVPDVPAGATGWVKVTTATDGQVDFVLAPVLNAALDGKKVSASAVAAWGPVSNATTIPVTFSLCEFGHWGGSIDPPTLPEGEVIIDLHDPQSGDTPVGQACNNATFHDMPGGFGWLAGANCLVELDADGNATRDPGNNVPNGCDPSTWQGKTLLIPLYDSITPSRNYHIAGFVGFEVTGYKLNPHTWNTPPCSGPGNSGRCIQGHFTEITTTGGQIGDGPDYGARVVQMIG